MASSKKSGKKADGDKQSSTLQECDYVYACEWGECEEEIGDMALFVKHIAQHVTEYVSSLQSANQPGQTGQATCFSCNWRECESQILGNYCDFNRHVYFHAFHVRLKCLGKALLTSSCGTEACSLDGQSRNWIPELPENLICGWKDCELIYDNPVFFYSHVNQHCDEYKEGNNVVGGARCKWTGCDTLVRSKYKLKEHIRSHSQEKVVACPTCGGLFANRTKFIDHQKRQADTAKQLYQCSHCNKRFATARILRDHMRHHVNHYKCPFCDMTCPAPSGLRSHIRYRHTQEKPFKCGHCSHSAKSAADLRRHLDSHNETALFRCQEEDCNFDARTYPALASHHLKVHQNSKSSRHKYACHVCERKFSRGTILTKHLKTKHKFKWPSGHSRFRYKLHDDGYWRLQTVRYESIEVTDQYLNDTNIEENTDDAAPVESTGNREVDVAMETETSQVPLETETNESDNLNQEHYNLDLLGQVALQNSQSSDVLKTISIADIHQSEDQENTRPVFINVENAVENVPLNQSMPNNSEYTELTSSQSLVYEDQSGTVLQTLSVVSVSNACLDMPVICSDSTGN